MINYDYITKENTEEDTPNWTQVFSHPYRILKFGGSGWRKKKCIT